jgi:chromosome segregation protein
MPYQKGHHPGATWRKSDLQCHSPRDRGWTDPPSLPGGSVEFEAARQQWAEDFVAACMARGIRLLAVTDHHDMSFVPYVQKVAEQNGSTVLLPGVEITCSDNTQCLAFFDPSAPQTAWDHLLGKLKGIQRAAVTDAKTAPTKNAEITISDLFADVCSDGTIKDVCVLLPHFSDRNAHKSLNEDGHHGRFAALECDGVYIEKPFSDLEPATIDKCYGKIPDWGTLRRAIIATGDNRSSTWDRLGAHECWIKLGDNTIEALRQALLADEARIAHTTPSVPLDRIVELKVLSTLTGAEVFSFSLNAGFNAVIGGRGSGKSALLSYLRFGLGRTDKDLPNSGDDAFNTSFDREAELIDDTLGEDGYVQVTIEREGVREVWLRTAADKDIITVTVGDDDKTELPIQDAQRRFRARAFRQKGLSTTMNNSVSAAEQITGIAAAEHLDRRREVDTAIDRAKRQIAATLREQTSFWQLQLEHRRASELVRDLTRRIAAISQRLEQEGVGRETLDVIAQGSNYDRARNYQGQVNRARMLDMERLGKLKDNFLTVNIASFSGAEGFPEIAALHQAVQDARTAVIGHLDGALAEMIKLGQAYGASLGEFTSREEIFKTELAAATAAQAAHKQLLEERAKLTQELQQAEAAEIERAEEEETNKGAPQEFAAACAELDELLQERVRILSEAAHKVESQSGNMLKAKWKADPIPRDYVDALTKLMLGSRVHDVESKCQDWVAELRQHDAQTTWAEVRSSFLSIYKAKIAAGSPAEPSEEQSIALRELIFSESEITSQQAHKIFQNLDDDRLSEMFAAANRDYIVLTYVDQGRDIEFAKASPGQQASALLELLLSQSAGTLIIDQPEDDLDNRIIMQIVSLIRKSKDRRQLLFTTHNPNIVVNGDADKIIALTSSDSFGRNANSGRVQIDVDGAIETPEIRKAITQIMEGGKEAFDLRNRKYRFDTIPR